MGQSESGSDRSSDILDAILDKVSDDRTRTQTTQTLFRSKALDQLDVAADIDNQLPLVSRRSWLLLVGVGCIVVAFLLWAALTPSTQSEQAQGRVIATSGLESVSAPANGMVESLTLATGTSVAAGATVGTVQTSSGSVPLNIMGGGTTWQVLRAIGSPTVAGQAVATILPQGSEKTALLVLDELQASSVRPGMRVTAGGATIGTVTMVEPPVPAPMAEMRTGISTGSMSSVVVIDVALTTPGTPGALLTTTILLTDSTVLQQLLGR